MMSAELDPGIASRIVPLRMPPLGKLEDPPINEVVCGVLFKPVANLDPVVLGSFWQLRRDAYPRREFKAPIAPQVPEGLLLQLSPDVGPLRTWLISKDDVLIIQVQHDRFYLNWRARQGEYPRFNDWDGKQGLLSKFLAELRAFTAFVSKELGDKVELQGLELAKVDRFDHGRHWQSAADLAELLPMLRPALDVAIAGTDPEVAVRLTMPLKDGSMDISIGGLARPGQPQNRALKLECRRSLRRVLSLDEVEEAMKASNSDLNDLFQRLVPDQKRFEKGWRP